jgi:DNA-directed RNA polymerase II subunit RPB1
MCHRGYILPSTRNGINRIDGGPLRKCSFEETLEMLLTSAAFGKTDPLNGVSENIMLGQLCRIGTGYFDLLVDHKKLKEPRYIPNAYNDLLGPQEEFDDDGGRDITGMQTPIIPNTPNPFNQASTPSGYMETGTYGGGAFTPNVYNFTSPAYTPRINSPSSGTMMSPYYPIDNKSPGYVLGSPQSSHSPGYSPIGSTLYNPISPNYSPSASPSLSSSDRGRGVAYSPSSPHYGGSSPKYSPSYSGSSPKSPYSSSSPSGTPGSQPMGSNSYTPNTPGYKREGGVYLPTSPSYNPDADIIREEKDAEDEEEEK